MMKLLELRLCKEKKKIIMRCEKINKVNEWSTIKERNNKKKKYVWHNVNYRFQFKVGMHFMVAFSYMVEININIAASFAFMFIFIVLLKAVGSNGLENTFFNIMKAH